jgi:mannan endo-1,4-beta-mannosidase
MVMKRKRRVGPTLLTAAVVSVLLSAIGCSGRPRGEPGPRLVGTDLRARDSQATPEARQVYRTLAGLENEARAGRPGRTVIGQHAEVQNERYNPSYGDYHGVKQPGYYYLKAADITGHLPGFLEVDLGPGYQQSGWGVGEPRSYSRAWPSCRPYWGYVDDAVDLAVGVWKGLPRPADGGYDTSGAHRDCSSGATVTLPHNGGRPSGIVGMSFHEPYPGSARKGFEWTRCRNSPAAHDPDWFHRVVTGGTTEHEALLDDLSYLADHLGYLAAQGVPVLLRPYHEMNAPDCGSAFWWAAQRPELFRELWRTTYDYLVHVRRLHNLIFVWAPSAWAPGHATEPSPYYPGSAYVDVVGVDDYSETPHRPYPGRAWTDVWYRGLGRYGKPREMAESFYVPLNGAQPRTLTTTPWVLWTVWGQGLTADNAPSDVKRTYGSTQVITGSDIPLGKSVVLRH